MMNRLIPCMVVLTLAVSALAFADKPDKGKGKNKGQKAEEAAAAGGGFSAKERDLVHVYFVEAHGKGKCPPGLAKKNNGCLPPGQARKRYALGEPLSSSIEIRPLPAELEVRIGPPPSGYRYAIIDGDLVKLVVGTLLVVDAIDGLVR